MKYLAFYDIEKNEAENRDLTMSVVTKLNYIFNCIDRNNIDCEIISISGTLNSKPVKAKKIKISDNITLELPFSLGRKNRFVRILDRWQIKLKAFAKLLKIKKNDTLVVYHTMSVVRLVSLAKKIKDFKLIIEVEEIYGDVWNRAEVKKRELKYFRLANKYIFSTELLNEKINTEDKPYVTINGTYGVEKERYTKFNDNKIHIVYAGILEPQKGCLDAVRAAEFLDESYVIHILGYGRDSHKNELERAINEVNSKSNCQVIFEGTRTGEKYIEFLQSCHIGLSPQLTNAGFNEISFPSKVLSYLSNGLRVVSIGITSLRMSKVGGLLFFYEENSPKAIANTIKSIDLNDNYDSREKIKELDIEFTKDILDLIKLK